MNTLLTRFWSKVSIGSQDECWLWIGSTNSDGYGIFWLNSTDKIRAHRFSFQLANKNCELHGLLVCHRCDTPSCVNPNHLFLGSNLDNTRDRQNKGRCHGRAKLTHQDVCEIRRLQVAGKTMRQIANIYQITHSYVSKLCRGTRWAYQK